MTLTTEPPGSFPGDRPVGESLAKEFGLTGDEYRRALDALGREPSFTELGVFAVMWSEHCSYKTSRVHLSRLPTSGAQVVQGPGENAGAVDIGDGYCAVFKMESHNHPSYIEPYQGAATGVGGILRDVFTMGARPVALLNSLRFGSPKHENTPRLLRGVVAGIGGYGNSIGVPTVGGEVQFDKSYNENILVNAFAVGVARIDGLFFGKASGVGNPILYIGAKTGRDGIHGATMASADFDDQTEQKLPTVQVGDPFMEKLLLEACLELFQTDCLAGIQDMGAAGLTSSSVEMAARGGTGVELNLDAIPRRTERLSPYELLLSESQERMLLVAKEGREQEVIDICKKWDLDAAVVGRVTDSGRFVCKATPHFDPFESSHRREPTRGERKQAASASEQVVACSIPIDALTEDAPRYERPMRQPRPSEQITADIGTEPRAMLISDPAKEILDMLAAPNIGSRRWIYRQYDHIVRNGTVMGPGESDAAVIRVLVGADPTGPQLEKYLALSVDCNGRHVLLDPWNGAAMAVAECCRNIVCSGAEPLGLTDCLNFGNPEVEDTMWRFAKAIDGIAEACNVLRTPVVSGNVSLYNETNGRPILPTPTVAVVGKLASPGHRVGLAFTEPGHLVAQLGASGRGHLGGSEWLTRRTGHVTGEPLRIDLSRERALQDAVLALAREQLLRSAHDVSDGGLAVAVAECCLPNLVGAKLKLPGTKRLSAEGLLFGEEPSRVIVSFTPDDEQRIREICVKFGVPYAVLGETGGDQLKLEDITSLDVNMMKDAHLAALESIVG